MSRLSVYWSVAHRRAEDYDYFAQLRPTVVKIMDGGPPDYAWVRDNLPHATLIARDWALSEQHEDMLRDPVGTGQRHAEEWADKVAALGFDRGRTLVLGINEPHVWEEGVPAALNAYTVALCDTAAGLGLRVGAMQLSVGWPANHEEGSPPDWSPFADVEAAILRGNHALVTHEYWAELGPAEMWGWWGGRTLTCPWQVPIIIGETGFDRYVKYATFDGNRGWRDNISPETYAAQLADYVNRMQADPRFVGACVFASDFASDDWWSFDIQPAYNPIIAACAGIPETPAFVPPPPGGEELPPPVTGGEVPPIPPSPQPIPLDVYYWPVPDMVGISGRFGEDYPNQTYPHQGLDIAAPYGAAVLAVADGEVAFAGWDSKYGNYVRIFHAQLRLHTFYAHLSDPSHLYAYDFVEAGEVIGYVGASGNADGPHLHLETRTGDTLHGYFDLTLGYGNGRCCPEATLWTLGLGVPPPAIHSEVG